MHNTKKIHKKPVSDLLKLTTSLFKLCLRGFKFLPSLVSVRREMLRMLYTGTHICSKASKHANSTKVFYNMMLSETLLLKLLCLSAWVFFFFISVSYIENPTSIEDVMIIVMACLDTLTQKYPPELCN